MGYLGRVPVNWLPRTKGHFEDMWMRAEDGDRSEPRPQRAARKDPPAAGRRLIYVSPDPP
jgi:hypothetical protein